jgi:hypothetical protein
MKDPFDNVTSDMFEPRGKVTKAPSIPFKEGMARTDAAKEAAKEAISKASGKLNIAPLPEGMPKLTDAIAKADAERAERAERKASKVSGGGGGGAGIPKVGPKKPFEMKKGGMVYSASKRADGCAIKGKTKGRIV